jgi:acyl-CoA thioesterase
MSQEGRPILDAMVWSVGEVEGLVHRDVHPPDVPDPDQLRSATDRLLRPVAAHGTGRARVADMGPLHAEGDI